SRRRRSSAGRRSRSVYPFLPDGEENEGPAYDRAGRRRGLKAKLGFERLSILVVSTLAIRRIIEEKLITIGIIDHKDPVAPRTVLDRNALGRKLRAQAIQRRGRGHRRLRLDVQGNEHQGLANLLRPRARQDQRASLPINLCHVGFALLVEAPRA